MAKIGNESKLILKLAGERIQTEIKHTRQLEEKAIKNHCDMEARLRTGQIDGMWYAMTQYASVVSELESK